MAERNYPNAWVVATISLLGLLAPAALRAERSATAPAVKPRDAPAKVARASLGPVAEAAFSGRGVLAIGYLDRGSDLSYEGASSAPLLEELRESLLGRKSFRDALGLAGYAGVGLARCENSDHMIRRMSTGEFAVVFATAQVFTRHLDIEREAGAGDPGAYDPVLQFRLPGDVLQGRGVGRGAIVFIGPGSSLWESENPTLEEISVALWGIEPAIVGTERLAEYIVPLGELAAKVDDLEMAPPLVCGDAPSVVKHVVSGLVQVGICDKAALDRWGTLDRPGAEPVPLYRVVLETEPTTPTDPILIATDLLVADRDRRLASELILAISEFFNQYPRPAAWAWVDPSNREFFESWARTRQAAEPEFDDEALGDDAAPGVSVEEAPRSALPGL